MHEYEKELEERLEELKRSAKTCEGDDCASVAEELFEVRGELSIVRSELYGEDAV